MYPHLSFGQEELAHAMRTTYDELIDFVTTSEFKLIMKELGDLQPHERPAFVLSVLLDESELAKREIKVPPGVLIQRSAFGDRRPTLFCVKKFLPERFFEAWQNVNLTFDNIFVDESVSRAPEISWRPPLPVEFQAEVMAAAGDLEKV